MSTNQPFFKIMSIFIINKILLNLLNFKFDKI